VKLYDIVWFCSLFFLFCGMIWLIDLGGVGTVPEMWVFLYIYNITIDAVFEVNL